MERILVFDTTLRDGEQSPGATMTTHEKVRVAQELEALASNFDDLAMPARGRYVKEPAVMDAGGIVTLPPSVGGPLPRFLAAATLIAAAGVAVSAMRHRKSDRGG